MTGAYPLHWPNHVPRTPASKRESAQFKCTFFTARAELATEIERLGGKHEVLSTNVPLRIDGQPRSGIPVEDPGVAVYFEKGGKSMCFACDKWLKVEHNVRAIQRTIEAIRGIERWGSSEMAERAFSGFEAIAAPGYQEPWYIVLGFQSPDGLTLDKARAAYREKAKLRHPDSGGSEEAMATLNAAIDQAREHLPA